MFVSAPTSLNPEQEASRTSVVRLLKAQGMEPRALGRREYPVDYPLREVAVIAKHCSGGVILGFEQFRSVRGVRKPGTAEESAVRTPVSFPTPWNHLEAGILFGLRLPLLIFRERGVTGGIFDNGVTDVFVHDMPAVPATRSQQEELREVVARWQAKVRSHYYHFE